MAAGTAGIKRFDAARHGAIVGAVLPMVVFGAMAFGVYVRVETGYFLRFLAQEGTLGRMVCLATLGDAALFFVAIYTRRLSAARGLLGATISYALLSIALALTV